MVIADYRYYLCGEVHGSRAQWIYAACSRSPGSLGELDRLLPEFGAKESLRRLFGQTSALDLAPVDAGLIIIDLAKKWIYADTASFSASLCSSDSNSERYRSASIAAMQPVPAAVTAWR